MIAFLDGTVAWAEDDALVLDTGGVGYRVYVPGPLASAAVVGEKLRIFTYQHVREDALLLYGFAQDEERRLFIRLQNAGGVGPKLALQMISFMGVPGIVAAVRGEDAKALTRVPGIGGKTAQRLLLELKDRLDDLAGLPGTAGTSVLTKRVEQSGSLFSGRLSEVQTALEALGFGDRETVPVLRELSADILAADLAQGVKLALRALAR
ncbi:MAG: Holliday junction branch migration protein RuvA [Bacilli bacterium]